jgi:hypothetical protein
VLRGQAACVGDVDDALGVSVRVDEGVELSSQCAANVFRPSLEAAAEAEFVCVEDLPTMVDISHRVSV